ncbi:hypothetical protein D3C77_550790 [compost metagenome]
MIAKRPLRLRLSGMDFARNDEIGIMANAIAVSIAITKPPAGEHARNHQLAHPLRQRHDSG